MVVGMQVIGSNPPINTNLALAGTSSAGQATNKALPISNRANLMSETVAPTASVITSVPSTSEQAPQEDKANRTESVPVNDQTKQVGHLSDAEFVGAPADSDDGAGIGNSPELAGKGGGSGDDEEAAGGAGDSFNPVQLSKEELQLISELASRDREVRSHELAHQAVGGQYTGAAAFSFQTGPDGKRYAIGGEVPIDVSPAKNPEATIQKMRTVKAAALAPAEPSPQDLSVAATATQILLQAQIELASERAKETAESSKPSENTTESSQRAAAASKTYGEITGLNADSKGNSELLDTLA